LHRTTRSKVHMKIKHTTHIFLPSLQLRTFIRMSSYNSIDQPRTERMGSSLSVWLTFFSYTFVCSYPFFIRPFVPLFEQWKESVRMDEEKQQLTYRAMLLESSSRVSTIYIHIAEWKIEGWMHVSFFVFFISILINFKGRCYHKNLKLYDNK